MEIKLDCLPCFLSQVLGASRLATDDEQLQKKILRECIYGILRDFDAYRYAPQIGRAMHGLVKKYTGINDPYKRLKQKHLQLALAYYPDLKRYLFQKTDRLYWALKIAGVGNVFDAAINSEIKDTEALNQELVRNFKICHLQRFKDLLKNAKKLLIIGDNAGETVFDSVLIEELLNLEIYYAVRSGPIINDATVEDAEMAGLHRQVKVISTGCDAPGVVRTECNTEFNELFATADIVISKGQGNYETLSEEKRGLFFLLKAKCPVIAEDIGVGLGEYVFMYSEIKKPIPIQKGGFLEKTANEPGITPIYRCRTAEN